MIGYALGAIWVLVFAVRVEHCGLIAAAVIVSCSLPVSAGALWFLKWLWRELTRCA